MIALLLIRGLRAHVDTVVDLDATGTTEIVGASAVGVGGRGGDGSYGCGGAGGGAGITGGAVQQARVFLDHAKRAEGARAEHARALAAVQRDVTEYTAKFETAAKEAVRCERLVDAVRRAPTEIARAQIGTLGDLGAFGLELLDDGGVRVTVDGVPWTEASSGRQIVGDTLFRAGLRRALGLPSLPLFVDAMQSVGCDMPDIAPPLILLRTVAGEPFGVVS